MFSEINKLYGRPNRHAESADTRKDIKRHDPDIPTRVDDEETRKPFADLQDDASVSVEALRAFLQNFVAGKTPPPPQNEPQPEMVKITPNAESDTNETETAPAPEPLPSPIPDIDPKTKAAMAAYRARSGAPAPTPPASRSPQIDAAVDMLGAEDVREIYSLLDDLKTLSDRGVQTLTIVPRATFLDGLRDAARLALILR